MAVVRDGVRRMPGRPGDVVHELAERDIGIRRHGIANDQVSDLQPPEGLAGEQRAVLRRRGLQEKPADEGDPERAVGALPDGEPDAAEDEEVAEALPDERSDVGRPAEVAARAPEGGSEHAASVEWQRGQEVEEEEDEVDVAEPRGDAVCHLRQARFPGEEDEHRPEDERHEGARDRDPKLRPGTRKHSSELGDAAEEPERDALDLDSFALGLERVPELVHEQRGEEEKRRDDRHAGVSALVVAGVRARKDPGRERPNDEREDDRPAPVHAEANAGDAAQRQAVAHGLPVLADLACDLGGALRHDGPVLASLLRGVFDDLPALLRRDALPAPLGLKRECDELPRGHPRHVPTTNERLVGFRAPRLDDPDAGTDHDQAEQGFGIALLHPYAAVRDRVPHGRRIRSAVDAHARDGETHPAGSEWVFGTGRDRIEVLCPAGVGWVPPWMTVLAHDPKPTMGRGRPCPSGCNREDTEGSSAPVEVKPVRVAPDDDETACRSSVASLPRRQSSRPVRSLAVEGSEGRGAHDAVDLESRMALEATDRRDAQASVAAVERAWRVPVRA